MSSKVMENTEDEYVAESLLYNELIYTLISNGDVYKKSGCLFKKVQDGFVIGQLLNKMFKGSIDTTCLVKSIGVSSIESIFCADLNYKLVFNALRELGLDQINIFAHDLVNEDKDTICMLIWTLFVAYISEFRNLERIFGIYNVSVQQYNGIYTSRALCELVNQVFRGFCWDEGFIETITRLQNMKAWNSNVFSIYDNNVVSIKLERLDDVDTTIYAILIYGLCRPRMGINELRNIILEENCNLKLDLISEYLSKYGLVDIKYGRSCLMASSRVKYLVLVYILTGVTYTASRKQNVLKTDSELCLGNTAYYSDQNNRADGTCLMPTDLNEIDTMGYLADHVVTGQNQFSDDAITSACSMECVPALSPMKTLQVKGILEDGTMSMIRSILDINFTDDDLSDEKDLIHIVEAIIQRYRSISEDIQSLDAKLKSLDSIISRKNEFLEKYIIFRSEIITKLISSNKK